MTPATKRCSACHEDLPANAFYVDMSKRAGLASMCVVCTKRRATQWRAENADRKKALDKRYYAANREQHNAQSRAYYAANKDRLGEWQRAYNATNATRVKSAHRAYYAANKQAALARVAAWASSNPQKARAAASKYRATPRGLLVGRLKEQARRARKASVKNDLTRAQWLSIVEVFGGRCAYCLELPAALTLDHVIPLAKGGEHTAENVVPACSPCNSAKGDRSLFRMIRKAA